MNAPAPPAEPQRPRAPILLICGHDFLDVHSTSEYAAAHLAADMRAGVLDRDRVDAFDAAGRPLDVWTNRRGDVRFSVAGRAAEETVCRRRLEAVYEAARHPDHAKQRDEYLLGGELPELPDDFGEMVATLAEVFDADHHPGPADHVGSRLHNFWHAIAG